MAEKLEVYKEKLRKKGFFNYGELYKFCYTWLKEEGYKISEDKYGEKLAAFGKEIKLEWTAKKKVSDYFRNVIKVKWLIIGMNDAEIERDGRKEKTNKGEAEMDFTGILERDYESRWEDQPFWKMMRGVYDKYVIRTTMEEYEDKVENKVKDFVENVKAFLELEVKK